MKIVNIYCPVCKKYGREKLLFKIKKEPSDGVLIIWCKGCHKSIELDLKTKTGELYLGE